MTNSITELINTFIGREENGKTILNRFKQLVEDSDRYDKVTAANHIISVIVQMLNFTEAVQSLESPEKKQDNSLLERIYYQLESEISQREQIIRYSTIDYVKGYYNQNDKLIQNDYWEIKINEIPLLLNPWNGKRIINNLININDNNIFDGKKHAINVYNHYLYPMNMIVCHGANHSQFSAKIKNQGKTVIRELYNFSNLYDFIEFDGKDYLRKDTNKRIKLLKCNKNIIFYSGIIFEMGRYILESNYHCSQIPKDLFGI